MAKIVCNSMAIMGIDIKIPFRESITSALCALLSLLPVVHVHASAQLPETGCILDQTLFDLQQQRAASLHLDRSDLQFANGEVARNCLEYNKLLKDQAIGESVNNQLVKSEYLSCDALVVLQPETDTLCPAAKIDRQSIGEALSTRLDLRSFPSSLFMKSNTEKRTLDALYPAHSLTSHDAATQLETGSWLFHMQTVAIADANGNGIPDWVIWVTDEAKQGNYRSYFTLIIYDPTAAGRLAATPFPEHLRTRHQKPSM